MSRNDVLEYDAWIKINGCDFCLSHLEDVHARWCLPSLAKNAPPKSESYVASLDGDELVKDP